MPSYVIDSIGRMRHPVVIQQNVNQAGIRTWTTLLKVFCSIVPESGTENPTSQLNAPDTSRYRVRTRYLPGVRIRPRMRLLLQEQGQDDRTFEIDAVLDTPDERHQYVDMFCREVTT